MRGKILGCRGELIFVDKSEIGAIEYGLGEIDEFDVDLGDVKSKTLVCKIHLTSGTTLQVCTNLTPKQVENAISNFKNGDYLILNAKDYETSLKRRVWEHKDAYAMYRLMRGEGEDTEKWTQQIEEAQREIASLPYSYERFE